MCWEPAAEHLRSDGQQVGDEVVRVEEGVDEREGETEGDRTLDHPPLLKLQVLSFLVDCPTQLTLVIWICQLSRRWEPFKRGSKIFGAFLQPGKDIWGQFFCKMYFVCL